MSSSTPPTASVAKLTPEQNTEAIRQIVSLAIASLQTLMNEGDSSMNEITGSFTSMAELIQELNTQMANKQTSLIYEELSEHCSAISKQVHDAVIAFQFYDRTRQKICHISDHLLALTDLLAHHGMGADLSDWENFRNKIRRSYSMHEECALFDALMAGGSISDAIDAYHQADRKAHAVAVDLF